MRPLFRSWLPLWLPLWLHRPVRLLEPWRTRVLWVSLGLNLFAASMLAVPHLWRGRPGSLASFDALVERMSGRLPAADGVRFRDTMARERPWFDASRQALATKREAVAHQVAQEPFDPAAVRAALVEMQTGLRESMGRFDDSLVMAMGQMSPEGRAGLAEALRRRRR